MENILRHRYFMYMDGTSVNGFQGIPGFVTVFVASLFLPFFDRVVYGNPGERSKRRNLTTDV